MTKSPLERALYNNYGHDYDQPRKVPVRSIEIDDAKNIDDLICSLWTFRAENACLIIEVDKAEGDFCTYLTGFTAYRLETYEEVKARIATYAQSLQTSQAWRRAQYQQMKREFGDA